MVNERTHSTEDLLLDLLKREEGYYSEILTIESQEDEKIVAKEAANPEFRALLDRKKWVISKIQDLEIQLEPLKAYWKQKTDRNDLASKEIELELEILDKLLRDILRLSEKNRLKMESFLKEC